MSFITGKGKKKKRWKGSASISSALTLSTAEIEHIVECLKSQRCRDSTRKTYHRIWRIFALFYAKLDVKPTLWSDRIVLFTAFLIDNQLQSSTVKSYISAIRGVLAEDGIVVDTDAFLLTSLTSACRLINDQVIHRFPIYKELLHEILKEIDTYYGELQQQYLATMYKAIFLAGYYGLLRAGEMASGPHALLAKDVHVGRNKQKFLFILWTSKTHGQGSKPQRIKISSYKRLENTPNLDKLAYCPFQSL